MRNLIFIALVLAAVLLPLKGTGQEFQKKYKYYTIGWNINAMNYMGELDPAPGFFSPGLKFTRHNIGISFSKKIFPRISARANVSRGVIEGSDERNASFGSKDIHRKIRNLSFKNTIWEVKVDAVVDLKQHFGKPLSRVEFTPYLFAGVAYYHHNPRSKAPADLGGHYINLQPLALEGKRYSLHQLAVPAGFGMRFKLSHRWDLAFEAGWRFTFTDYLDDVSGHYKGPEYFEGKAAAVAMSDRSLEGIQENENLRAWTGENLGYNSSGGYLTVNGYGREGDQRGDPGQKDGYLITGFHFTYILYPKVIRCVPRSRRHEYQ